MPDTAKPFTRDPVIEDSDAPSLAAIPAAPAADDDAPQPSAGNGESTSATKAGIKPPSGAGPDTPRDPLALAQAERELVSYFGLRRNDQLVVAMLAAAIVVFSGLRWADMSDWGTRPIEIDRAPDRRYAYQLDPNTANWIEWMQLPDVGETLARRIVEDREERGPFRSIEDLDRVDGIGPRTIERIRPWLREPAPADPAPLR
jgi:competence protein ComEA